MFDAGYDVEFYSSTSTGQGFASELAKKMFKKQAMHTSDGVLVRLLYPCSAIAGSSIEDTLKGLEDDAIQFQVDKAVVYENIQSNWSGEERTTYDAEGVDVVTFGSPSAMRGWLSNVKYAETDERPLAACIGVTTQRATIEGGWMEGEVFYPIEDPGLGGWARATVEAVDRASDRR
jgi:uroporphyrinogen-III synthase